jgi:soluble lytic murein transglycosylase-like protein
MKAHPLHVSALAGLVWLAGVAPAIGDVVHLSSGRTMSVASVRFEASDAVISLRSGGQIVCDRALVVRVDVEEVPPEAAAVVPQTAAPLAGTSVPPPVMPEIPAAYKQLVTQLSTAHRVDERLVHAVIAVESAYQPRARSPKGARGLMQLMPSTARQYGVRNAYNPGANLEAGIRHLRALLDRFELSLALAAYNAGETAVRKFGGMPPYRETQEYVAKVLALASVAPAR